MQCTRRLTKNFIFPHCHFMTFNKARISLTQLHSELLVSVKFKENWPFYIEKNVVQEIVLILRLENGISPFLHISKKTHQMIHNNRVWSLSLSLSLQSIQKRSKKHEWQNKGAIINTEQDMHRFFFFKITNIFLSCFKACYSKVNTVQYLCNWNE